MDLALNDDSVAPLITWEIIGEYQGTTSMLGEDLKALKIFLSRSTLISSLPNIQIPEVEADHEDTIFVSALIQAMREFARDERPKPNLVTMDHHLLDMVRGQNCEDFLLGRIVTPEKFLRRLGK